MSAIAFGTVITKNYLAFARVLAESLRRFHAGVPCFVALADEPDGYFEPQDEPFTVLSLADLSMPHLEHLRFCYTRQQMIVAAKPFLIHTLLDHGFDHVIFLDADILILHDLSPLIERVMRHAMVLTPHLLQPPVGGEHVRRELNILQSGVFNGGFVGTSNRTETRQFLQWWQQRLLTHCRHDVQHGMYYDQCWLGFAPSFIVDYVVERDPVYNVAYWNLPERPLDVAGTQITVGSRSCGFFHFSGFDPVFPDLPTRYNRALTFADLGSAHTLFQSYAQLLYVAGYDETRTWPYSYGQFHNGVPIPVIARHLYSAHMAPISEGQHSYHRFGDPFDSEQPNSFFAWLQQPADLAGTSLWPISRLWHGIYQQRADVRTTFPAIKEKDRHGFLGWAAAQGTAEHDISQVFCVDLPGSMERTLPLEEEQFIHSQLASVPHWYHQIPIREGIVTPGINDCATTLDRLHVPVDCRGLRVLDLGTRDGFFAFELERRGADVVAVDYVAAEQSGFAVAAALMNYQGLYIQENIYNLDPTQLGTFDIVLFLGLLYHLPDPIRALRIVRSLCHDQLFCEAYVIDQNVSLPDGSVVALSELAPALQDVPLMCFMPGRSLNNDPTNYWGLNMKCLERMLAETMFDITHQQRYDDRAIVVCKAVYDAHLEHYGNISSGTTLPHMTTDRNQ